jgi:hypothetical protein
MHGSALKEVARSRHAEPLKLISLLRGDLDWIVIRALEKDRTRRYQTANGLAMDVQRFLDNEPVMACPPSRIYRLQKLVRRNKVTFIAGTTVAAALVIATGVSTFFWYQESQMRKQAVAAEQQQARLRVVAENRVRISEAAYLTIQGSNEDADSLLSQVAISEIKASLDSEQALRGVGAWYAIKGQWAEAFKRFTYLWELDQRDNSWAVTDDLLMFGPVLIEMGDLRGYEEFRQETVARFADTRDPIFAERALKISLLTPPDPKLLKQLEPLSDLSTGSMAKARSDDTMAAWRCISLALMAYRQGYTPTAKAWCQRCLSYKQENPGRRATAHVIQAMSCYQLGETNEAVSELADGRKLIDAEFENGLSEGNGAEGFWYDWLFARILLREADALVKEHPQPDLKTNVETGLSVRLDKP